MSDIQTKSSKRQSPAYLTRKQLPGYIREQFGVPVKFSTLNHLAGQGRLKPDKFYGKTELYTPQTADKLVKDELLSDRRANLRLNQVVEPDQHEAAAEANKPIKRGARKPAEQQTTPNNNEAA